MPTKNAVSNYEQEFYIDGIKVPGVTNIDGGYRISEEPINIIGKGFTYPLRQGPLVGNFNINKYFVGKDIFLDYINDNSFNGSINYDNKNFGFSDGYLDQYSITAGIGRIPSSSVNITAYGGIGAGVDSSGSKTPPALEIVNQGSISLNTDGYQSNRISDFSYNIRINRNPIYKIGSNTPVQVDTAFPIVQEMEVNMEIFQYEIDNINNYITSPKQHDVALSLKNPINNNLIETFNIYNARINNSSISSDANGVLNVALSYIGYINRSDRFYSTNF